ncbi:MAG: cupin domain-containing protein [Campylobacterota bacterium]|nr:cupin domain-containing protein [Campylobacterota bacterium]
MKTANIFSNIPKQLKEEVFEDILLKDSLKIERIVSKGHSSPKSGWHVQDHDEWVIVLQGEAILSFEKEDDIKLGSGDYINIKSGIKHKVTWTLADKETIWLAIHH